MFKPIEEWEVEKLKREIDIYSDDRFCPLGIDRNEIYDTYAERIVRRAINAAYVFSLNNLCKKIANLDRTLQVPSYTVDIYDITITETMTDGIRGFVIDNYQDYLNKVREIKRKFNYDKLVEEHKTKQNKWEGSLAERLSSLRRPKLTIEEPKKLSEILSKVKLPGEY